MAEPFSSVNMDRLKDGNVEYCRLFVVINKFLSSYYFNKIRYEVTFLTYARSKTY